MDAYRKLNANLECDIKHKHYIAIKNTKADIGRYSYCRGIGQNSTNCLYYDSLRPSVDIHQKCKAQQLYAPANVPTNIQCSLLDIPNFEKPLNVEIDVILLIIM